jgi:hypothetical protein
MTRSPVAPIPAGAERSPFNAEAPASASARWRARNHGGKKTKGPRRAFSGGPRRQSPEGLILAQMTDRINKGLPPPHGSESGLTERIGGKKKESSWLRRHPEDSDAELFEFNLIVHNGTVLPQAQDQVTFDGVALT